MKSELDSHEWEQFFDYLDRITNAEGTVAQKVHEIKEESVKYDSDTTLEEFLEYFRNAAPNLKLRK